MKYLSIIAIFLSSFCTILFAQEMPPVSDDEVGIVEQLPPHYPDSWVFVQRDGFPQDGSMMIIDVAATNKNFKGAISVGYTADVVTNNELSEIYVSETYYDRGNRGNRNDMITVYDQATLKPKAEITLDVGKRFLISSMLPKFQLTNNKKWALIANYTPASSITIVDLENRKILNEIPIPGCNLSYPLGMRGFATMCGYGEVISINLDENGQSISEHQSKVFNDIDNDPHFVTYATVGDVSYFPTFKGNITGIDFSGEQAMIGETWSLLSEEERMSGWRPGGWQLIASDKQGHLYITMHEKGYNGSHKDGGSEVWIFDPASKKRIARHALKEKSDTIIVTNEDDPHLVASREKGEFIDVYKAKSGEFVRSLGLGKGRSASTLYVAE